jgi:hypothetical protein
MAQKITVEDFTIKERHDCDNCYFAQFRNCDTPEEKRNHKLITYLLDEKFGHCIRENHVYVLKTGIKEHQLF